ncbi:MAG: class I SAM-dependent methyltransferase [Flavobacteriales bacterium]|nr:class I SAM-dependent methyltransferase [Flavobacteriales bacterium]
MSEDIYTPTYVQRLFDRMSSSYERMNYLTSFGFSLRWRRQFLAGIPATTAPVVVIDLLTGMGETWGAVHRRFPNARLSALDFSEGMLRHARAKSVARYGGRVEVLHQDVLQNHLPSAHFDIVTCAFGLKTFNPEQLARLAQETLRILKPGGRFAFVEVSEPNVVLLRALYGLYLGSVIPVLGRVLLGDPAEYKMLWRYTSAFGHAKAAMAIFQEAGLQAAYTSHFYGCATGFHGVKAVAAVG